MKNTPFVRGGSDDVCHGIALQFSVKDMGVFTVKKPIESTEPKQPVTDVEEEIAALKSKF